MRRREEIVADSEKVENVILGGGEQELEVHVTVAQTAVPPGRVRLEGIAAP